MTKIVYHFKLIFIFCLFPSFAWSSNTFILVNSGGRSAYEVMGLSIIATREEVRQTYFQFRKDNNADSFSLSSGPNQELHLNGEAFNLLKDDDSRLSYDLLPGGPGKIDSSFREKIINSNDYEKYGSLGLFNYKMYQFMLKNNYEVTWQQVNSFSFNYKYQLNVVQALVKLMKPIHLNLLKTISGPLAAEARIAYGEYSGLSMVEEYLVLSSLRWNSFNIEFLKFLIKHKAIFRLEHVLNVNSSYPLKAARSFLLWRPVHLLKSRIQIYEFSQVRTKHELGRFTKPIDLQVIKVHPLEWLLTKGIMGPAYFASDVTKQVIKLCRKVLAKE